MAGKHDNGDGFTSEDRNLLRVVAGSEGFPVTLMDMTRMTGLPRQRVFAMASSLVNAGLLTVSAAPGRNAYAVTDAGRRELDSHATASLLVKVDDRLAEEVAYYIERNVGGVISVTAHNVEHPDGCCCQHCPHDGNCR